MPIFLIAFRESLEAFLIVGIVLSILTKYRVTFGTRTVVLATLFGFIVNLSLLMLAGTGVRIAATLVDESSWELVEGVLMLASAVCITYVVFWLHRHVAEHKSKLLGSARSIIDKGALVPLFAITFTAVVREGVETVLILAPYLASQSLLAIATTTMIGITSALGIVFILHQTTSKLALTHILRINSLLLVLFAGGLIIRGIHEITEKLPVVEGLAWLTTSWRFMPNLPDMISFLTTDMLGWKGQLTVIEMLAYIAYILWMGRKLRALSSGSSRQT